MLKILGTKENKINGKRVPKNGIVGTLITPVKWVSLTLAKSELIAKIRILIFFF
jgi:hypothetical protein